MPDHCFSSLCALYVSRGEARGEQIPIGGPLFPFSLFHFPLSLSLRLCASVANPGGSKLNANRKSGLLANVATH